MKRGILRDNCGLKYQDQRSCFSSLNATNKISCRIYITAHAGPLRSADYSSGSAIAFYRDTTVGGVLAVPEMQVSAEKIKGTI